MDDQKQIVIGGDTYNIVEEIARGGMGVVYKGSIENKRVPQVVALKIPSQEVLQHEVWRQKFDREARVLANIDHKNVVRVVQFGYLEDQTPVLVQEFLRDFNTIGSSFSNEEISRQLSIALQSLYGLRATHGESIELSAIHRDLSPKNIMFDTAGLVKIIDFGLAKEDPRTTEVLTRPGEYFGTPGCMAPEQITDPANSDLRVDIFSFGKTLAASIQSRDPQYVELGILPDLWREFCTRAVAYEAEDRFQSAEDAVIFLLSEIRNADLSIDALHWHIEEIKSWDRLPVEFPQLVFSQVTSGKCTTRESLKSTYLIPFEWFESRAIDPDEYFQYMNNGPINEVFENGSASFSSCDPLGDWLAEIYPLLSCENQGCCFRRMCSVALKYHRYSIMYNIRAVVSSYSNEAEMNRNKAIWKELDPTGIISVPEFEVV